MKPNLIIEICPHEPRASLCMIDGESVMQSEWGDDIADCTRSGDAQPACEYVLDRIGVEFRIVARNARGEYENRLATDDELRATCEEIYFESDTDFSDRRCAEIYLVWNAACDAACEESQA